MGHTDLLRGKCSASIWERKQDEVWRETVTKESIPWRRSTTKDSTQIIQRDLSTTTLPPITDDSGATQLEESKLTPAQRLYLSTSDELIEELQAANTVVIGAPMYNFSIPSSLKAWIDQIVRIGKTFGYGPNGHQGLLGKKSVVVITARGGAYEKGTTREALDFQEPYLRHILGLCWFSLKWKEGALR